MSVKWTGVLPYTYLPYYEACKASMSPEFREHVLFINNTDAATNLGCMASHNRGVDAMRRDGSDWLVIMSPAIRFGSHGGMDFIAELEKHPDHNVVEAAGVYGWHLLAFSRKTLEIVGNWDENLTPYSFDDIDLSLRIQKAFNFSLSEGIEHPKLMWDKVSVDVTDTVMGHSLKYAKIEAPADPRIDYIKRKWGQHPGQCRLENTYEHPFNDESKAVSWWPLPPDERAYDHGRWKVLEQRLV